MTDILASSPNNGDTSAMVEQTKQTNPTTETQPPGRPADVSEQDIIDAGKALSGRGARVTASALRREIGRGRPERLKEIWDAYLEAEAAQARRRDGLPETIRSEIVSEVEIVGRKIEDIVATAYAKAIEDADAAIAQQRANLEEREAAAKAEVQDAYLLLEDADAQHADARRRISDLEADLRAEREARLASEKRAAESESVVKELRAQVSASKTENDELRASLGELRAFKERVQKQAQHKKRSPNDTVANDAPKSSKAHTARNA